MNRFSQLRVRLLAAIALGLAAALVVEGTSKKNGVTFYRRLVSFTEQSESGVVSVPKDASSPGSGATKNSLPTPDPLQELAFVGGPDEPPLAVAATPSPAVTPLAVVLTPTTETPAENPTDKPGASISVATPYGAPTKPPPEDNMVGTWSGGRGIATSFTPPARTPQSGLPWVTGQSRGYAMLYALQPEARAVTESNISALLESRIREPYIGLLIDGSFGRDFEYLKDIIKRLNADGRRLTLCLYLSNGPAQRRRPYSQLQAPFLDRSPEEFRRDIRRDPGIKASYSAIVADARALYEYNLSVNPDARNVVVPMLEDNLDSDSFREILQWVRAQLEGIAVVVRNPCVNCGVPGSDDQTFGNPREIHNVGRFDLLERGDGFTLDGVGFSYPSGEGSSYDGITPEKLVSLLEGAYQQELLYFGLWRHGWQGVKEGAPNVNPKARTYTPSTPSEIQFEIQALRAGLPYEIPEEDGENEAGDDGEFLDAIVGQ